MFYKERFITFFIHVRDPDSQQQISTCSTAPAKSSWL
jgi:hypothetical protein